MQATNLKEAKNKPLGVDGSRALDPNEFGKFLGIATWLMTCSAEHKGLPISWLSERVLPALLLKQFKIIMKNNTPIAFLTWATVSQDVADKLATGKTILTLPEWRSGKQVVVVDCVSPFGPADQIEQNFLDGVKK
ncbi:MAG: toxin-activating lysine-acyltransferase [Pseudomonadota bacterium]